MGMDLVPRKRIRGFHANWGGWSTIQVLLYYLDQDLTRMDGSNDGRRVPAKTAKAWGQAVKDMLERREACAVHVHDPSYAEKVKVWAIPKSKFELFRLSAGAIEIGQAPRNLPEIYLQMCRVGKATRRRPRFIKKKTRAPRWLNDFLAEFAEFCLNSGGFEQC